MVGPAWTRALDVGVRAERVAAVLPSGTSAAGHHTIDASGCLVLPGGVDPHCHYTLSFAGVSAEQPEYSVAAAFGGTTTLIDFAVQIAPSGLVDAVAEKHAELSGRMAVDYGLHAILTGDVPFEVIDEIGTVIADGIPTIKTFMTYGLQVDDGHRLGVMQEVARHGGMSVVHAEDDSVANWPTKRHLRDGKRHGAYIVECRPPFVEEAAVRRAILLAEYAE